jgi:nitronate monooxygenase
MAPELKQRVIQQALAGPVGVFTDPFASPTGFPFKVLDIEGSLGRKDVYDSRTRICDLGYLRQLYRKPNGTVGYRCAAEPEDDFVEKGGSLTDVEGRKCLCNGLMATAGFPQVRKGGEVEPPILTAGDAVAELTHFLEGGRTSFTAADVLDRILESAR